MPGMIFDGFVHQLPDIDPSETQEWLDSLDAVVDTHGKARARFLLSKLLDRARASQVSFPATVSTPYVNTIPREHEPWFPGDEHIERRIRAFIRWNAATMVVKANKHADGIGGHLSTFASSASLYEIGFNHFFRGKEAPGGGDHVYFQGHAAPGIYARAYLEGRLTDDDLDHFRQEIGRNGRGLSSYPHPRLMPDFWEYPTVSMGLGPINAHLPRTLPATSTTVRSTTPRRAGCGAFLGDGECDEPETLGSISLAAREAARQPRVRRQLQPAAPRRPGARQRQDHPGARGRLPRRRLERDQGHLGFEVGRAARSGHRRRAAQQDEHHRRRQVPEVRGRDPATTSATTSSAPTRACARWSSTSPTTTCATCPAAGTTTASSTPPTRPPPNSGRASPP
jgi:transketolase N-terminal domain/subunit